MERLCLFREQRAIDQEKGRVLDRVRSQVELDSLARRVAAGFSLDSFEVTLAMAEVLCEGVRVDKIAVSWTIDRASGEVVEYAENLDDGTWVYLDSESDIWCVELGKDPHPRIILQALFVLAYPEEHDGHVLLRKKGYEMTAHEKAEAFVAFRKRLDEVDVLNL
jgi:hypothetical protein